MKKNLSIIIVNWNTKDLLKRCIESIFKESKAGLNFFDSEVIVVDNGSNDGSVKAIEEIKLSDFFIKIIKNTENKGFAKAVNQGIRIAEGESIFLLNSDTEVCKDSLKKILEFEDEVGPAIIGARLINRDGSIQPSVFNLPTAKRAFNEYFLGKKNDFSKFAPDGKNPVAVEAVSGGAMLISKEAIEKIGLLDERYFMYFEDLDYCRRAKIKGIKVYYFPEAEIIHEHGASGKKISSSENQWKRLIPSAKIYYGAINYYLVNFVLWVGGKLRK